MSNSCFDKAGNSNELKCIDTYEAEKKSNEHTVDEYCAPRYLSRETLKVKNKIYLKFKTYEF